MESVSLILWTSASNYNVMQNLAQCRACSSACIVALFAVAMLKVLLSIISLTVCRLKVSVVVVSA